MATTKRSTNRPSAEALVAGDRHLMKALMKDALQEGKRLAKAVGTSPRAGGMMASGGAAR
ncbi:hypothetical protein BURKHO8Y_140341 [Burkholderia sp. 8Y]|uniref:hypothetical protein n=1 Tax=Burkholderia sp. 8Y TaxID=2653133 RepID=UPI0012F398D4|nr:hypothetical protein [Burkholderia sp. 8Y]VXB58571.1 hypothetical protein BURKHO8Y_140341 [Burkholderia sp. 8Y]